MDRGRKKGYGPFAHSDHPLPPHRKPSACIEQYDLPSHDRGSDATTLPSLPHKQHNGFQCSGTEFPITQVSERGGGVLETLPLCPEHDSFSLR